MSAAALSAADWSAADFSAADLSADALMAAAAGVVGLADTAADEPCELSDAFEPPHADMARARNTAAETTRIFMSGLLSSSR